MKIFKMLSTLLLGTASATSFAVASFAESVGASPASAKAASFAEASKAGSADHHEIQVDVGTTLGSSQKIGNFLGIQGVPATFTRSNPDQWGVKAWRELDLNFSGVWLFDEVDGISVSRNAQDKLELDFTNLEARLDYITKTLGAKHVDFTIAPTPKALSSNPNSDDSSLYVPANYKEWNDIVYRSVLHLKNKLGFVGAHFQTFGEVDNYCNFRGRPERKDGDMKILDDYIEFYVETWRAAKRADPTAKLGGPTDGTYSSEINRICGHRWGMDDYIQKFANYNRQHPTMKITLDEVIWQDYDWFNDGPRIAIGVKHIQSVLKANGFPSDTPQVLDGWNTDYAPSDQTPAGSKTLPQHAVYIVAMIVEQLNLGNQGLHRAYLWPFDYDDDFPNSAIVTIPYPEQTRGGEEGSVEAGFYGKPHVMPAVTEYCRRPAYAGLQMLAAMKGGQFVKTTTSQLPKGVQIMATRDKSRVIFLAANNSASSHQITVHFSHLPYGTGPVTSQLKRVDEKHSIDCQGLEEGSKTSIEVQDGKLTLPLEMPAYSVVQVSLEHALILI